VYSNIASSRYPAALSDLQLLGQPRDKVSRWGLAESRSCKRIGTAGWKYFSNREVNNADERWMCGLHRQGPPQAGGRVTNETALSWIRKPVCANVCEPEQIADFEWVAT